MSRSARTPEHRTRSRAGSVVLGAVATLVLPLLIGTTAVASATTYREWTLSGVTFDDGGTLSGTLIIADDGTPYRFDVTTAGGNTGVFGTVNYAGGPTQLTVNGHNGWYVWAPGFGQYLWLLLPDTTGAQQDDTLPLSTDSYECTNCGTIRYVNAGNIVAGSLVDLTAPEINASIDPPDPDGNHGWYVGNPTVSFTVTDPDSEITNETGCDPQTLDQDTTGIDFVCQATSGGGTSSWDVFVRRDATKPTLAPTVLPAHVLLNGPIVLAANAGDATSGVSTQSCSASTHLPGARTATCRTADLAGNRAKAKVGYTVEYVLTPIALSGKRRVGHQLQVAIKLTDATGHRISNEAAAALGCQVKLRVSGAQTHRACMGYNRASHQFVDSWTAKQAGADKLRVAVSYPHSSVRTAAKTQITVKA